MRRWLALLAWFALFVGLLSVPVQAAPAEQPTFAFYGAQPLPELLAGASGSGTLLYFLPSRGVAQPVLVVQLSHADAAADAVAQVYDAPPGQTFVSVQVQGQTVTLPRAQPSLVLRAHGGWWQRGEQPNYHLTTEIYGPIHAMWGAENYRAGLRRGPLSVTSETAVDAAGLPRWELRQYQPADNRGILRTSYAERKCATPLAPTPAVPGWPYLRLAAPGFEQTTGQLTPPIGVDWQAARITHFGELVTVRAQNCSYALFSIKKLAIGEHNVSDFETPFAFYDWSGRGVGYPNAILRTEHYPAGDRYATGLDPVVQRERLLTHDFTTVRYSWRNAVGDWLWDYKVEVMGFQPFAAQTALADGRLTIDAPDYESYPGWVLGQDWPVATFIAVEGREYKSSEGIYDWSPRELGAGYFFGWRDTLEPSAFQEIRSGLRGEYRAQHSGPPQLYRSPVDGRLHLLGAEGGLWRLDDQTIIRLHNLGGPAINGWTVEQTDAHGTADTTEQLYVIGQQLLYSDRAGVMLGELPAPLATTALLPPSDAASWAAQQAGQAPAPPVALAQWRDRLPGSRVKLPGAQLEQLRATPGGFRFVLTLPPGQGMAPLAWLPPRPGRYAVTFDGQFHAAPLVSADPTVTLSAPPLTALQAASIAVTVQSQALIDLGRVEAQLWATDAQGTAQLVVTRTLALDAEASVPLLLPWHPDRPGAWQLSSRLLLPDRVVSGSSLAVVVQPAAAVTAGAVVGSIGPLALTVGAALLLLVAGLAVGRLFDDQLFGSR